MSENQNIEVQDNFVEKYNFSRRVVDHRIPRDFNFSVNQTSYTDLLVRSRLHKLKGDLIHHFGLYYSLGACFLGLGLVYGDAYIREYLYPEDKKANHFQDNYSSRPAMQYVSYQGNQTANKGRWNHNFQCWENDKDCGKDFDIREFQK